MVEIDKQMSPRESGDTRGEVATVASEVREAIEVAVGGGGAWGTGLAIHAARLGHKVRLWALERDVADEINTRHENPAYLPGIHIPSAVRASCDLKEVLSGAALALFVTPAQHLREISSQSAGFIGDNTIVVVASKGIEAGSLKLQSEVLAETLPKVAPKRLAFLSGPSFAREIALRKPAGLVAASTETSTYKAVQRALDSPHFNIDGSNDVVGVQLGGALKNVIAILAGICDGLELGESGRMRFISLGLSEIIDLGVKLGANPMTFHGPSGFGDLMLTCTDGMSRNHELGLSIANGVDPEDYIKEHSSIAEGYYTAKAAWELSQRLGVHTPVIEQVYRVLYERLSVRHAVDVIMKIRLKKES